jgi:hypothetical protein
MRRMRRLAAWSGRRVLALWLVWFVLLASIVALYLGSQRRIRAPVATRTVSDLGPVAEQHTDVVVSVVGNPTVLRLEALVLLLGPPGFLTALWLYARQRPGRMPPGV